ncbi:MAG TPA: BatA domain-containing protein, partial [Vicinamibacterales bacterium]|nr:BatA domain-containing protein [Vicinamibacterales bacterium]
DRPPRHGLSMSILWTAPLALIGLSLVALPVIVHLFARQPVRRLDFPSLRFLRETQLAAFRRRRVEDAVLLACRAAIVAAAAVALAGPVVQTTARSAGYANRLSRAMVITGDAPAGVVNAAERDVFRSARFQRASIADAIAEATRWLDAQPRSSRELLVVGPLRRGDITAADFALLPPDVGIRFEQSNVTVADQLTWPILALRDGQLVRVNRAARLHAESTAVSESNATPVDATLVTIRARAVDTPLAEAALRAALRAGIPWRDFNRPIAIVWTGGVPPGAVAPRTETEIIRMPVPEPPSTAASAVHEALAGAAAPPRVEPIAVPQSQLDALSRRPGVPPDDAPIADEGDRRWIWALSLALLALEWWLRRRRAPAANASAPPESEARVA